MRQLSPKPCQHCGQQPKTHFPFQCPKLPRPDYNLNKAGKRSNLWKKHRRVWLRDNQPSHEGYYHCYLCGKPIKFYEVTLDHVKPKGSHPELALDFSNLQPCCFECNSKKGSKSLENYKNEI